MRTSRALPAAGDRRCAGGWSRPARSSAAALGVRTPGRRRGGALRAGHRRLHRPRPDPGRSAVRASSRPWPATPPTTTSSARSRWPWPARSTRSAPRRSTRRRCTRAATTIPATPSCSPTLTGTPEVSMMLTAPQLRVIHVTTHIGLIDAIAQDRAGPGRAHDRAAATTTLVEAGIAAPADRRLRHQSRTPARTACSATARKRRRSCPAVEACQARGSTSRGRCPPTRCSSAPGAATSTWWSRCITTRATARSRCWASRPA